MKHYQKSNQWLPMWALPFWINKAGGSVAGGGRWRLQRAVAGCPGAFATHTAALRTGGGTIDKPFEIENDPVMNVFLFTSCDCPFPCFFFWPDGTPKSVSCAKTVQVLNDVPSGETQLDQLALGFVEAARRSSFRLTWYRTGMALQCASACCGGPASARAKRDEKGEDQVVVPWWVYFGLRLKQRTESALDRWLDHEILLT